MVFGVGGGGVDIVTTVLYAQYIYIYCTTHVQFNTSKFSDTSDVQIGVNFQIVLWRQQCKRVRAVANFYEK
jgi:hypothetical protein